MSWGMVAVAGAAVVGAVVQSDASKSAGRAAERAGRAGISAEQAALESFERRTQPFADIGLSAAPELQNLLGLSSREADITTTEDRLLQLNVQIADAQGRVRRGVTGPRGATGSRFDDRAKATLQNLLGERETLTSQLSGLEASTGEVTAPSLLEEINPLVSFLRDEGFEDIQNLAAARGRLGAGGTLEDLTRFNTQIASTVAPQLQQQRFNQLFNVLGLGANVASGQGTAGQQSASNVSNLLGNIGQAQAAGAQQQGQIGAQLVGNLAGAFGAQQGGAFRGNQGAAGGGGQLAQNVTRPNQFGAFS